MPSASSSKTVTALPYDSTKPLGFHGGCPKGPEVGRVFQCNNKKGRQFLMCDACHQGLHPGEPAPSLVVPASSETLIRETIALLEDL